MPSTTVASTQRTIIRFYDPAIGAADIHGRTLSSILMWSDAELEDCHNYIQTLFPLPEPSFFSPDAPLISSGVFTAFRTNPELRNRLKESFCRMLTFYGFKLYEDGANVTVVHGLNFDRASLKWVTRFNHNHLRITRIIRCLRVLGLEQHAAAFFLILQNVCRRDWRRIGPIGGRTREFWTKAATLPLYLVPDDRIQDNPGSSGGFLWDFEEYRRLRGGEQRDGYESGVIAPEVVARAENQDSPPALTNGREDSSEGSDKADGAVVKVSEAKSSSENESDAPAFSTRSKKRKRSDSNGPQTM